MPFSHELEQEILVVDDSRSSRGLLSDILTGSGYRVRTAADGAAALALVTEKSPDLILLDVELPDLNGFEVCRRLKSAPERRNVPVLFISSLSATLAKMKGFEAGGVDFVTKPFDPQEVLARVGTHLSLRVLTERLEQTVRLRTEELTEANRRLVGAELERLSHVRFLESLEQVDRAIRQAESLDDMMTDVLDTALAVFSSDRAWLLYPCDTEAPSWRVPMERTRAGYPGALVTGIDLPTTTEIREVFLDSLNSPTPVVYDPQSGRPLPSEVSERFSIRSQIMMAVYPKRGKPWLFGMHQCSHARVWSEQDVRLFQEIGRRIADGLSSLLFLRELQESGAELERRVADRTCRLEAANAELTALARQLESAYEELKSAQARVLQQEKMASIGQLAAGVAHEINNPMGFIISNLHSLDKYAQKISGFFSEQCRKVEALAGLGDARCDGVLEEMKAQKKALKLDWVIEDLTHLVRESLEGAERVKTIVLNLKSFSRVEASEIPMLADINAGIESTIKIIWNELKYKAVVNLDLGPIPEIECNLGQLNQVFLNILMNAAQAMEQVGTITVKSWCDEAAVYVAISDTGAGIPAEKLPRIFEPFFTTKAVGEGTGLGLSIVYDIVKKHDGEITVASEVGKGTAFTIALPTRRPDEPCSR